MDRIWTFIGNMTLWNWLTLTAFAIALMSGLNAFLSLKSRYLDWKGGQSKKGFEERLEQLQVQLFMIEQYKKQPSRFLIQVLDDARKPVILFLAFCAFMTIPLFSPNSNIAGFAVVIGQIDLFLAFLLASRLSNLIARVNTPELFAIDVLKFVNKAKRKGLLSRSDDTLYLKLLDSKMFNASERIFIEEYWASHLE